MSELLDFVSPTSPTKQQGDIIESAAACLDRFTECFNTGDARGMDGQLHFPHIMFSGSARMDWQKPGQHPPNFFEALRDTGWHHTAYESKQPVLVSSDKVHFVVVYSRRDANDNIISLHTNLWIVTCSGGKWGICLRSY